MRATLYSAGKCYPTPTAVHSVEYRGFETVKRLLFANAVPARFAVLMRSRSRTQQPSGTGFGKNIICVHLLLN